MRKIATPRASLLALLALAGCQLFDTRPKVEILPAGLLVGGWEIDLVVKAADDPPTAIILIDGRVHGEPVAVNRRVTVKLYDVPEGMHTLSARIDSGSAPRQSADSPLLVRPPPPELVDVQPPAGPVDPWTPLAAELTFSEAVTDLTWTASSNLQDSLGAADIEVVLSADRTRATVRLARPMVEYGWVWLVVVPYGPYGNASWTSVAWKLPDIVVTFDSPAADGALVHGTVSIEARSSSPIPDAELLLNGVAIATLGPSPWALAWDSTSVPSGSSATFTIRRAPLSITGSRSVQVDNIPPTLLGCQVAGAVQPGVGSCIVAEFSEPVIGVGVSVTVGGLPWSVPSIYAAPPYTGDSSYKAVRVCPSGAVPALPVEMILTYSAVDLAGNAFTSPQACTFTLERWWRPWGDGPVAAASGSLVGRVAEVRGGLRSTYPEGEWNHPWAYLLLLGGPQDDGLIRYGTGLAGEPFPLSSAFNASPAAELAGGIYDKVAWVERTDGPGLAFSSTLHSFAYRIQLNVDATHDARHVALDDYGGYAAWSEETEVGGRAVWAVGGPLGSDPAGVADFPSIVYFGPAVGPAGSAVTTSPAVAFVDTPPGGVPSVRVAGWNGKAWLSIGGALNIDPATAAGEPLLLYSDFDWLVFVEADQVIARHWDTALQEWGAPWFLNSDPGRLARAPRRGLQSLVVAFLEAGPSGDEIRVRRWNGSSWDLLPGAVNEGIPGTVTSFTVGIGTYFAAGSWKPVFVAWTDDAGLVRIRVSNE